MKDIISGSELKSMFLSAAASVDLNKRQINDLNVFPVPDGDTGTNMALTLGNAAKELGKADDSITVGRCAEIAASALLRGARGNSGVITSLLFRGFAKYLKEKETMDGLDFAMALGEGVENAYKAVMKPAEGTILTVSRVSAESAREACQETTALEAILEVTLVSARAALEETVNQNPVLKKAGVIDAGGKGFVCILEGMKAAVLGAPIESQESAGAEEEPNVPVDLSNFTFTYDTVFIVRKGPGCDVNEYGRYLSTIGDSLVIGEDDEVFKVHVHTDTPGAALTEAAKYGTLELAKIENMRLQYEDMAIGRKTRSTDDLDAVEAELEAMEAAEKEGRPLSGPAAPEKKFGFLAVCAGDGLSAIFRDLGADGVVSGGQTMNPSTESLLAAVEQIPAETVFILPNNGNIIMAAQQCAGLTEKGVVVIPTKSIPQGITALMNVDFESEDQEAIAAAMNVCLSSVTTAQITYAARNSDFDGFDIRAGDYLALEEGKLFGTDSSITAMLERIAQASATLKASFISLYFGADVKEEDAKEAGKVFEAACPDAEVAVLYGGQPVYYYIISIE